VRPPRLGCGDMDALLARGSHSIRRPRAGTGRKIHLCACGVCLCGGPAAALGEEAEVGGGETHHDTGARMRRVLRFGALANHHDCLPPDADSALLARGEPTGRQYSSTRMRGETSEQTVSVR
jgi:hypothetical protein